MCRYSFSCNQMQERSLGVQTPENCRAVEILGDGPGRLYKTGIQKCPETVPGLLHQVSIGASASTESAVVLCRYVAFLAEEGLKHRTIKAYLAAVRFWHISEGVQDPFKNAPPRLHYILRGIKRAESRKGLQSIERLPITPTILQIKQVWEPQSSNPDIVMLWAASCIAFLVS